MAKEINTKRFKSWEDAFLKSEYTIKTDAEIAHELNRKVDSISRRRKTLGLIKEIGRPSVPDNVKQEDEVVIKNAISSKEYDGLTVEEKKKYAEQKFKGTSRYRQLKNIISEDEIDFYCERWMEYISTWETLLTTEEDTLHLAIMELILANRILARQKQMQDEAEDGENIPIDLFDRQYQAYVDGYNKLMASLSGTRQQRLSSGKDDKLTLVSIVQKLQDTENRKKAGEEAAAIDMAKLISQKRLREQGYLLDGN